MFSMASMTDVIFLLLIFFMVTSTFVFPSALEVNLPQSSQTTAIKPGLKMYATQSDESQESELMPLEPGQLEPFMRAVHAANPQDFIAVYADEIVPYGSIVEVLDKGSKIGLKIVLATKPVNAEPARENSEKSEKSAQAQ